MAWDLILHIVSLLMSFAIVAMIIQQILCIMDLEADYINPFDATSSINRWIIPEFVLQAVLCILCLFTGHWILFLLALPITYYHATLFLKREHLVDVTEVFRKISFEKKFRLVKLGFCLFYIILIVFRTVATSLPVSNSEEIDLRSSVLDF